VTCNARLTVEVNFEFFFFGKLGQFLAVINGQNQVKKFFLGERPFLAVMNGRADVEKSFF